MELRIASALKTTAIRGRGIVRIKLPPDASDRLFLGLSEGKDLAARPAEGTMVIIQDSLVTVLVTDVCNSS